MLSFKYLNITKLIYFSETRYFFQEKLVRIL